MHVDKGQAAHGLAQRRPAGSGLAGTYSILASLALQNLGRRPTRTSLLVAAVALSSAIAFAGAVMTLSFRTSLQVGFSRLGADLMVVAQQALTNITPALLTVEPTDKTVAADLFARTSIPGISRVAAQRIFRTDRSGLGAEGDSVDLIGFDPERDFTVLPWIADRLGGPMAQNDVIVGAARRLPLGSRIALFGQSFRVYARLAPTGVGTHERGIFLPSVALLALAPSVRQAVGATPPELEPDKVTGFLAELASGVTEQQVRFAILAQNDDVKVIGGGSLMTGIRQGLTTLVGGLSILVALMLLSIAALVGILFSAIIAERRREIGLLKAIGGTRGQIVGALVIEAMIATGGGGLAGVPLGLLLLRLFEHSLVYQLAQMGIPFLWLSGTTMVVAATACVVCAALVGSVGALGPALRAALRDPYDLIDQEG